MANNAKLLQVIAALRSRTWIVVALLICLVLAALTSAHFLRNGQLKRITLEKVIQKIDTQRANLLCPILPEPIIFEPFLETIDPGKTELGQIVDFEGSSTLEDTPAKPRFDIGGYPVLTVETSAPRPSTDIIYFYHWYDKTGVPMGVRDSYHMLRATSSNEAEKDFREQSLNSASPKQFIDTFTGIPARHGAKTTAFFIQNGGLKGSGNSAGKKLTLYGQNINRKKLSDNRLEAQVTKVPSIGRNVNIVEFGATSDSDIVGRGVRFRIQGVSSVTSVRADHTLLTTTSATEFLIGTMMPQVLGYKTTSNTDRTLYFAHTDLIKVVFDPAKSELLVDAYDYEFRERTTRSSTRYPDANHYQEVELQRTHPNLGVVDKLPAGQLTITRSCSDTVSFPLWQPSGYLASFAITEHADYEGVEQNTLTMYGAREPEVSHGAGILGAHIPLTKTSFAMGSMIPFKGRSASSEMIGSWVQNRLEESIEYLTQVSEYKKIGGKDIEIGAHCLGSFGDKKPGKDDFDRAFSLLAEFKSVTWVDHGGPECLWETGWDSRSPYYMVPFFKKYSYKYFNALGDKYDGRLNMIANNEPSNLLFYSVGLDDDITDKWQPIFFNTVPLGFTKDNFTTEHIRDIVNARGLVNIHTYLPYESLLFEKANEGPPKLALNPWYPSILSNLATANRNGDLYLATTEKLNDFMWKIKGLTYYTIGETVHVSHPDGSSIEGLTMAFRNLRGGDSKKAAIAEATTLGERYQDGVRYIWYNLRGRPQ